MHYENPQLPEDVNYSQEHPLKELVILLAGALVLVTALVLALSFSAGWLAKQIPFASERAWARPFVERLPAREPDAARDAVQARLQTMVDRIARLQGMPADMQLTVHLQDDELVNAFATIGGHLIITRGILEKLPHENALVVLLAHEAAHVKHRDPVVALGRGVAVVTALGLISGFGGSGAVEGQLQNAGLLTVLSFNRAQESAADDEALRTLRAWYGNTAGAAALFNVLTKEAAGHEPPALLSTHPASAERLARMRSAESAGDLVPLPVEITAWVAPAAADSTH